MFASFKEGKIFYKVKGKGTAIILLHGFLESSVMWNDIIKELSKKYRTITIDLLGHGKSDCFGYVHPMSLMADAVYAVIKKLRLRKVVIIGHSMGGYVGLAFARKYSQYLKGLCLFHSTALPDTEERKLVREKAIKVVKHNKNRYIKEMIYGLFAPELRNFFKKAILLTIRNAQKTSKQGIIAAIEGMKIRPSSEDVLQAIQVPVGFIAGKKDIGIPYESIQKQAKLPKVVRAIYLNEVAHMGHIEEPEACLKFLNQFITLCKKYKP